VSGVHFSSCPHVHASLQSCHAPFKDYRQASAPAKQAIASHLHARIPLSTLPIAPHVSQQVKLTSNLSPHSLAVAKGCQPKSTLHLTDQALMLPLMQRNTALNHLQEIVKPSVYDWGQPTPTALPAHPDVILAADCCYFEPAFPLLLQTLQDLIGERTVCYFSCVKRRKADAQFMKAARKVFEIESVDDDPFVEEYRGKNVFL
jgi:hypothetical protein